MRPTGGQTRYYKSTPVNAAAYKSIPETTMEIPPEFRFIQVLKGGYLAKHPDDGKAPRFLKNKVRLKFIYNDGRVIDNQYIEVESASFSQVDYTKVSRTYAKSGSTVRLRSAPNSTASVVENVPIGDLLYLTKRPENITEDWAEVRHNDNTGWMMSQFIVGTPAYQRYIATKVEVTIKSATITDVFHSNKIAASDVKIKTRYHESWFNSTEHRESTSKATVGFNFKDDAGQYFHSQKQGYCGYHDASVFSGAITHTVFLNVTYSDNSTGKKVVDITTEPVSNYNSIK
jgi:hypothetical protein